MTYINLGRPFHDVFQRNISKKNLLAENRLKRFQFGSREWRRISRIYEPITSAKMETFESVLDLNNFFYVTTLFFKSSFYPHL